MKAIIKSAEVAIGAAVRAVPLPPLTAAAPLAGAAADHVGWLEGRVAELEAQIVTLTAEAEDLKTEIKAAYTAGEAEGRKVGLRQAGDREAERVAALAKGIGAASKEFAQALSATGRLAALMANECLNKLFGESDGSTERVCALLRTQMSLIERRQLVGVVVSAEDFGELALEQLRSLVGDEAIAIRLDPELPPGSCKLQPRLGEIDIGLRTQWREISTLLLQMAECEL